MRLLKWGIGAVAVVAALYWAATSSWVANMILGEPWHIAASEWKCEAMNRPVLIQARPVHRFLYYGSIKMDVTASTDKVIEARALDRNGITGAAIQIDKIKKQLTVYHLDDSGPKSSLTIQARFKCEEVPSVLSETNRRN